MAEEVAAAGAADAGLLEGLADDAAENVGTEGGAVAGEDITKGLSLCHKRLATLFGLCSVPVFPKVHLRDMCDRKKSISGPVDVQRYWFERFNFNLDSL